MQLGLGTAYAHQEENVRPRAVKLQDPEEATVGIILGQNPVGLCRRRKEEVFATPSTSRILRIAGIFTRWQPRCASRMEKPLSGSRTRICSLQLFACKASGLVILQSSVRRLGYRLPSPETSIPDACLRIPQGVSFSICNTTRIKGCLISGILPATWERGIPEVGARRENVIEPSFHAAP